MKKILLRWWKAWLQKGAEKRKAEEGAVKRAAVKRKAVYLERL